MSQRTIAAARQKEMKTSIAGVTTMICGRGGAAGAARGEDSGGATALRRRVRCAGRAPRARATRRAARPPSALRGAACDSARRSAAAPRSRAASDGCPAARRRRRGAGRAASAVRPPPRTRCRRCSVRARRAGRAGRRGARAGWRRRPRARWSTAARARGARRPGGGRRRAGAPDLRGRPAFRAPAPSPVRRAREERAPGSAGSRSSCRSGILQPACRRETPANVAPNGICGRAHRAHRRAIVHLACTLRRPSRRWRWMRSSPGERMRVVAETESGPAHGALVELLRRATVDRILRQSEPSAITATHAGAPRPAAVARGARPAARLGSYALAGGLVGAAGLVAAGLMALLPLADPGLAFLAAVLLTAVLAGLGPSILAAVLGLLVYDFLFVDPRFTLTVAKPQDVLSRFMFLVVAVLTSELTARVRDQAEAARRREERTAALYAFALEIAGSADLDDLVRVILDHVARLFGTGAALLLPDAGRLVLRAIRPPETALAETERATATWVWEHDRPAGRGTDTLPGGAWFHLPLRTIRGAVGVLALRIEAPGGPPPLDQRQLLEALAGPAAVAIERTRVDLVEAGIESIEDGLVVLDPDGVVVDVNEVACAILGFRRAQAVGVRFDDLGTHHPHYLRLREAVREFLAHPEHEHDAVELALFLRGRDHYYVLRPTPF